MEEHYLTREKITLDQVKPKDREDGYPTDTPKWVRKMLELIPGVATWIFILSPLIVSVLGIPEVLVFYVAFLMVYWSLRAIRFIYGLIVGSIRIKRELSTDWISKIKEEFPNKYDNLNYIYLCPTYREGIETLRSSIQSIADSDYDSKKIAVVMAIEEKFAQQQVQSFKILKGEFGDKFKEMISFVHPANIVGEVAGVKGANINWATREYVKLLKSRGEDIHDYLLISVDCDWRPHPKFLSAVAYKYLTSPEPDKKFYASAVHTLNNNLWRVPPLIRIHSSSLTMVILHNWVVSKRTSETFSAYVANLQTIHETEYWAPDIQNDDTAFYWNALIRYHGNFSGVEVYVPTYSDAVENETHLKTHSSLYKQQLRWGWGIIVFPITLAGLYKNKNIPLLKKLDILFVLVENRLFYLTVVYMLTLALPLLNIFSDQFVYSSAAYNLPRMLSTVMTALMLLNLPIVFFRRRISPIPKGWSIFRHIWDFIETFLVTINMLTFAFIPFIQAQTELMLGKGTRKVLYVTDKVAIKN
ncbi:glycosyltransferase family 2 protein [bacterium]|nr:glycosyltransferase family 2 protein [bacterium]